MIQALARELLAIVHHVADAKGDDARVFHAVLAREDVSIQRVRSTLHNLVTLGYLARGVAAGSFRVTATCKAPPDGTPIRTAPVGATVCRAREAAASRTVSPAPLRSIAGVVSRRHTPNSVFDVERL